MASSDQAAAQEVLHRPNVGLISRVLDKALEMGLPFLATTALIASCSGGGEAADQPGGVRGETVPTLVATTTTATTEPVPTTETTTPQTETTTPQPNKNDAALCKQYRDNDPRDFFEQIGVPNVDKLEFRGDCTGLPGDRKWGWAYPGNGEGFAISLDTTGFHYDARRNHYTELAIGAPGVPWDDVHPEYEPYDPLTLRQLAMLEPGTPLCNYLGTGKQYSQNLVFGRVVLVSYYNEYIQPEPETYVGVIFLNSDITGGTWRAEDLGVMKFAETGDWFITWSALGKCVDIPPAK